MYLNLNIPIGSFGLDFRINLDLSMLIGESRWLIEWRLPTDVSFDQVIEANKESIKDELIETIHSKVQYALESAILGAQSALGSRADEYINALRIEHDLTIGIDPSARHLEDGYSSYEMLPKLATGPKSKVAEDGSRYATVPLGKTNESKIHSAISMKASELIKKGALRNSTEGAMQMAETMKMSRPSVPSKEAHSFATASTKQDSSESWVNPGFAGVKQLYFINETLKVELQQAIASVIQQAARSML